MITTWFFARQTCSTDPWVCANKSPGPLHPSFWYPQYFCTFEKLGPIAGELLFLKLLRHKGCPKKVRLFEEMGIANWRDVINHIRKVWRWKTVALIHQRRGEDRAQKSSFFPFLVKVSEILLHLRSVIHHFLAAFNSSIANFCTTTHKCSFTCITQKSFLHVY